MEPWILAVALGSVAYVVALQFVVRDAGRHPRLDSAISLAPIWLGMACVTFVGLTVIPRMPFLGAVIAIIGAFSVGLIARMVASGQRSLAAAEPSGDVPRASLDYLIWVIIGVPLVLGAAVVVMAVGGFFSSG
jgi:hypothetical protein